MRPPSPMAEINAPAEPPRRPLQHPPRPTGDGDDVPGRVAPEADAAPATFAREEERRHLEREAPHTCRVRGFASSTPGRQRLAMRSVACSAGYSRSFTGTSLQRQPALWIAR